MHVNVCTQNEVILYIYSKKCLKFQIESPGGKQKKKRSLKRPPLHIVAGSDRGPAGGSLCLSLQLRQWSVSLRMQEKKPQLGMFGWVRPYRKDANGMQKGCIGHLTISNAEGNTSNVLFDIVAD